MENGRIIPRSASIKLDLKNAGSATFAEPAFFLHTRQNRVWNDRI